ncbi:hypothetical protein GOODEAATRI_028575 [Goodea atripinnis]|uniref:Uncharacterized protein n=1 Tax=Goodea atripinnis TaxID=208336 RepID=A0ABV0Q2B5_9TELE
MNSTILAVINTLAAKFDMQEKRFEELSMQLKHNCPAIGSLTKASESSQARKAGEKAFFPWATWLHKWLTHPDLILCSKSFGVSSKQTLELQYRPKVWTHLLI